MFVARDVVRSALLGSLVLLTACATATEVPPETAQELNSLKSSLASGKAQIKRTTDAARELEKASSATMEAHIAKLLTEVDALELIALKSRAQHETQQAEAKAYFAQWDSQLKTMSASVQEAGQERREQSLKSFDELSAKLKDVKGTFRPYMDALSEVARYLKTDKTATGVKAIQPRIEEALDVEGKLMKQIDEVTGQINTMLGA